MKAQAIKIATFLRIIDAHDGQLSLTNVALIVVLLKLVFVPSASLTDVGSLFCALSSYAYKKYVNQNAEDAGPIETKVDEMTSKLEAMQSKVSSLSMSVGLRK
jgi:hypothetical protein